MTGAFWNGFTNARSGPGMDEMWQMIPLAPPSPSPANKPNPNEHDEGTTTSSDSTPSIYKPTRSPSPFTSRHTSTSTLLDPPPQAVPQRSPLSLKIRASTHLDSTLLLLTFVTTLTFSTFQSLFSTVPPTISSDYQRLSVSLFSRTPPPLPASLLLKLAVLPLSCLLWGQLSARLGHARRRAVLLGFALQLACFAAAAIAAAGPGRLVLVEVGFALQLVTVRALGRGITTAFFTGPMVDLCSDRELWRGLRRLGRYTAVRQRVGLLVMGALGAAVGEGLRICAGERVVLWLGVLGRVLVLGGMGLAPTEEMEREEQGVEMV